MLQTAFTIKPLTGGCPEQALQAQARDCTHRHTIIKQTDRIQFDTKASDCHGHYSPHSIFSPTEFFWQKNSNSAGAVNNHTQTSYNPRKKTELLTPCCLNVFTIILKKWLFLCLLSRRCATSAAFWTEAVWGEFTSIGTKRFPTEHVCIVIAVS